MHQHILYTDAAIVADIRVRLLLCHVVGEIIRICRSAQQVHKSMANEKVVKRLRLVLKRRFIANFRCH